MTRIIKSCPLCGSGQINRRREDIRYKCGKCGEVSRFQHRRKLKPISIKEIASLVNENNFK